MTTVSHRATNRRMTRDRSPPTSLLTELLSLLLPRQVFLTADQIADFYKSREWATLRYQAFKYYGRRCMCCRRERGVIVVDHVKPVRTHPRLRLRLSNLQVLCSLCNRGKGSRDRTDWRTREQKRVARQVQP